MRHVLPRLQSRSPQTMEGSAQEELEQEIVSENVRVVRGDGVETASGRDDVNEKIKEVEKTDDEEDRSSQEEYSSWGQSPINTVFHSRTRPPTMAKNAKTTQKVEGSTSNLRRIRSALSLLSSTEPSPSDNQSRTPSTQSIRPPHTRQISGHATMPSLNISKWATPAPSPSIRRKNMSHPDITSLVEQWTSSGPANQTMMYKPHT